MRSLVFLTYLLLGLNLGVQAYAQHTNHSPIPAANSSPEASLGDYGFRHSELHASGIIKQLLEIFNSGCCDGGTGGECRVTQVRPDGNGRLEALLDGNWCPLSVNPTQGISLPESIPAVVCAARGARGAQFCPATYCAAIKPFGGT